MSQNAERPRMKTYLYRGDKNSYKANLHCHSTVSDGIRDPGKIKEMYAERGYSVVAFSDHNVLKAHHYLSDGGFLAISACEVDITRNMPGEQFDKMKTYHFNLYASRPGTVRTPPLPRMEYDDIDAINRYIQDRTDEGFLVSYNHPYWSMQNHGDYSGLRGCFAVEIYNHGCETVGVYGYCPEVYDEMLREGNRIYCLSTDDNHNGCPDDSPEWDSFGGFVVINSKSLEYTDIIGALTLGDFYSSQGPKIHEISIEGNKVYVKCSPAALIALFTDGRRRRLKYGDAMEEAVFDMDGSEKFIRVMCRDNDKKDANSNAFWL